MSRVPQSAAPIGNHPNGSPHKTPLGIPPRDSPGDPPGGPPRSPTMGFPQVFPRRILPGDPPRPLGTPRGIPPFGSPGDDDPPSKKYSTFSTSVANKQDSNTNAFTAFDSNCNASIASIQGPWNKCRWPMLDFPRESGRDNILQRPSVYKLPTTYQSHNH